jgi:hypothetical protein
MFPPALIELQVQQQLKEMRRAGARAPLLAATAPARVRWRHRLGWVLVDFGLHLASAPDRRGLRAEAAG